jgi:hypothetical protein
MPTLLRPKHSDQAGIANSANLTDYPYKKIPLSTNKLDVVSESPTQHNHRFPLFIFLMYN